VYAPGPAALAVKGKRDDLAKLLGHPVRVDAVDYQVRDSDVRGGAKVSGTGGYCTSGFVVKNSSGTTGVATAGHCEGINTYFNPNGSTIPLAWNLEIRDADQDVEIHTSAYLERPEFYADVATPRVLTGRRLRTSTAIGDVVCHRGESTGYSCGPVSKTNTQLTYSNACNGVTCAETWVTVTGNANTACYPGDSGGPVFISQTAVGLLKGSTDTGTAKGQCGVFYYMSIDFLPTGWTLVRG
jgi:V8-like Glu-specific endopeptidase